MKSVDDRFLMKNKEINKIPFPVEGSLLVKGTDAGFIADSTATKQSRVKTLEK